MPERIQLRRTKGWRKPAGAVVVARPSKWGNPWRVGGTIGADIDDEIYRYVGAVVTPEVAVALYRAALLGPSHPKVIVGLHCDENEVRSELAGHDLACWCPLDQPCHADILLEVANAQTLSNRPGNSAK